MGALFARRVKLKKQDRKKAAKMGHLAVVVVVKTAGRRPKEETRSTSAQNAIKNSTKNARFRLTKGTTLEREKEKKPLLLLQKKPLLLLLVVLLLVVVVLLVVVLLIA
jgi:hypothetical protein